MKPRGKSVFKVGVVGNAWIIKVQMLHSLYMLLAPVELYIKKKTTKFNPDNLIVDFYSKQICV